MDAREVLTLCAAVVPQSSPGRTAGGSNPPRRASHKTMNETITTESPAADASAAKGSKVITRNGTWLRIETAYTAVSSTERAVLISVPRTEWKFWLPWKCAHGMSISVAEDMSIRLFRSGKGKWNKFDKLEELEVTGRGLALLMARADVREQGVAYQGTWIAGHKNPGSELDEHITVESPAPVRAEVPVVDAAGVIHTPDAPPSWQTLAETGAAAERAPVAAATVEMVPVTGNTYPVRDQLKSRFGARWNGADRCWMVRADLAAAAQAIVPSPTRRRASGGGETKECWECGRTMTRASCRANGGCWAEGYCGC